MPNNKNKQKRHNNNNAKKKNDDVDDAGILITSDDKLPAYEVKQSEIFGRYLVAARDLSTSEIIIKQVPLVIGPIANDENTPVCLNCYRALEIDASYRCPECEFPLCAAKCTGTDHTKEECHFFKSHNLYQYLHWQAHRSELQYDYEAITILRCLMLKTSSQQSWQKLNEMEAHNEIRKKVSALWTRNQKILVDRIRNQWKLSEFSEEEIHTICGILEVNCFEVGGQNGTSVRALYPQAYLMCHDCVPNTNHTDDLITHELTVRTTKPLKKGETITLSYAYTLQGTLKRRQHLNEAKFFWCICERCKSSDELSTHASTLLCPKCTHGNIVSVNPLDESAEWRCQKCSFSLTATLVMNLVTKLYDELDAIGGNNINQIEMFMTKYSKTLHRNHYIFLSAKHSLCQLYGKIDGFLINELNSDLLKRKEDYCRDLLEVIDILEPGCSRLRGVILYELHAPVMLQITGELQSGRIKLQEFKKRSKEVLRMLKESYEILQYEPAMSTEHQMAVASSTAIKQIESI